MENQMILIKAMHLQVGLPIRNLPDDHPILYVEAWGKDFMRKHQIPLPHPQSKGIRQKDMKAIPVNHALFGVKLGRT